MTSASSSSAQLLRKGRKAAAAGVKDLCLKAAKASAADKFDANSLDAVHELLREILDPQKPIDEQDNIDWLKHLMAGGDTFEDFVEKLKVYDDAVTCGFVWTSNFVAYRCRTCGVSPCMSLCAECFHQGNHEGHDFNMFRSQAGGACDCGDISVMRKEGFCTRHGPDHVSRASQIPLELACVPELLLPQIIFRLVLQLRTYSDREHIGTYKVVMREVDVFVDFLQTLTTLGAGFKTIVGRCLSSRAKYAELVNPTNCKNQSYKDYVAKSQENFAEVVGTVSVPVFLRPLTSEIPSLESENIKHESLLDEIMFWIVKYEFPQPLVTFLLTMLPDESYKTEFTNSFIRHYSRMTMALADSGQPQVISNRMVHISVQLFSNNSLAAAMVKEQGLLHILLGSLRHMMYSILRPNQLKDGLGGHNVHQAVDCSQHVMKDHCYWPVVSDIINLLSHWEVTEYLVNNGPLMLTWLEILGFFQTMNVNTRELDSHIEFEPNTYYASFSAELELSASPMWAILAHLKSKEHLPLLKDILKMILAALGDWMHSINLRGTGSLSRDQPYLSSPLSQLQVSFHLSLHRYFAAFLSQIASLQDKPLEALLPSSDVLVLLLSHPLQAQIAFYEILSSLWVRNGLQIKGQAMTYIQCHFCNSTVDLDLFMIQAIACKMDPDLFLTVFTQRFHVWEWFSLSRNHRNTFLEPDQESPLLEGALTCLTHLFTFQLLMGMPERELVKKEMVNLICVSDRTHSQLLDLIPERCNSSWSQTVNLEEILNEVAEYKPPDFRFHPSVGLSLTELQQGRYVPKPDTWLKLYDPAHTLLRAVHRRDYQASSDRFTDFLKRQNVFEGDRAAESVWPPFVRLNVPCPFYRRDEEADKDRSEEEKRRDATCPIHPRFRRLLSLLHNKTLHAFIFVVLFKVNQNFAQVTEKVLQLTVNLLRMALETYDNVPEPIRPAVPVLPSVPDQLYRVWFPSDDIYETLVHEIEAVRVTENPSAGDEHSLDKDVPSSDSSAGSVEFEIMELEENPRRSSESIEVEDSPREPFVVRMEDNEEFNEAEGFVTFPPLHLSALTLERALGLRRRHAHPRTTESLPVNDCLLSLLVKLHNQLAHKDGAAGSSPSSKAPAELTRAYRLPGSHGRPAEEKAKTVNFDDSRVADGPTTISRMLDHIAATNSSCKEKLSRICDEVLSPPLKGDAGDDVGAEAVAEEKPTQLSPEERKKRAQEMQAKLMADMAKKQQAFLQFMAETEEDVDSEADGDPDDSLVNSSCMTAPVDPNPPYPVTLYDCCICNQSEASGYDNPIMMVALRQETKILGRRLPAKTGRSDSGAPEECCRFRPYDEQAGCRLRKLEVLFDEEISTLALPFGLEDTVHIQSCGHFLHVDCHKSYMDTQKSAQINNRIQGPSLDINDGEFTCPLCRQLANMILPVLPEKVFYTFDELSTLLDLQDKGELPSSISSSLTSAAPRPSGSASAPSAASASGVPSTAFWMTTAAIETDEEETPTCLLVEIATSMESNLMAVGWRIGDVVVEEIISVVRLLQPSTITNDDSTEMYVSFLGSVAQAQLEIELVQREGCWLGGSPVSYLPGQKNCFPLLLHCIAQQMKVSANMDPDSDPDDLIPGISFFEHWLKLTGIRGPDVKDLHGGELVRKPLVPVLCQDPTFLMIMIILYLLPCLTPAQFSAVVQAIYNLAFAQGAIAIVVKLSAEERRAWQKPTEPSKNPHTMRTDEVMNVVIRALQKAGVFDEEDSDQDDGFLSSHITGGVMSPLAVKSAIQDSCVHFVRIASLFKFRFFGDEIPTIADPNDEFIFLAKYLGLGGPLAKCEETPTRKRNRSYENSGKACDFLFWQIGEENPNLTSCFAIVASWCEDFNFADRESRPDILNLLTPMPTWEAPSLVKLPERYDEIFRYYRSAPCDLCLTVPREPAFCLMCKKICCFKSSTCCVIEGRRECTVHSVQCGGGTGIFLAVNSSVVVIISGKRVALWGSLYLDSHGEEDRDLKRGRPLFLSHERYKLLHRQWLMHAFNQTVKKWGWHNDRL